MARLSKSKGLALHCFSSSTNGLGPVCYPRPSVLSLQVLLLMNTMTDLAAILIEKKNGTTLRSGQESVAYH